MRAIYHRYERERVQLELAIRLIHHEARTGTISELTGLTDDRIRKLYQTYMESQLASRGVRHKRGKSPRNVDCLVRSAHTHLQASVLAGALITANAIDRSDSAVRPSTSESRESLGNRLCDAFELYCIWVHEPELTFEHTWFLWHTLNSGDDLSLSTCWSCNGLLLRDNFNVRPRNCPWCQAADCQRRAPRLHWSTSRPNQNTKNPPSMRKLSPV